MTPISKRSADYSLCQNQLRKTKLKFSHTLLGCLLFLSKIWEKPGLKVVPSAAWIFRNTKMVE